MNEVENTHLTNDELLNNACELTAIASQISSYCRILGMLEVAQLKNDKYMIHHEIQTGVFKELRDNLNKISTNVQHISNTICPD